MKNLSFAIIGGGPAGFYTAKLLSKLSCAPQIHIYEKQLCPFGLIRYGVAPDHISIKKSQIVLSQASEYQNFRYIGNKYINSKTFEELKQRYSGIIYAYGAGGDTAPSVQHKQTSQQAINRIKTARQLVYWYNNHPNYENHKIDLSKIRNVSIIGNGNVAIDIARIFLRNPEQLRNSQISPNALESLYQSSIMNVNIIARRGVVQSAFALKQIRQLTKYNIKLYAIKEELQSSLNDASYHECTAIGDNFSNIIRMNKRKLDFIKEKCQIIPLEKLQEVKKKDQKKVIFRFLLNPFDLKEQNKKLILHRTSLSGQPFKQKCLITGQNLQIEHDLLIFSTGFQVNDLEGLSLKDNCIPNSNGCILKSVDKIYPSTYASGWCKTGPQGVIDQTLLGCQQTFNNIRIHYENNLIQPKNSITDSQIFNPRWNINFDQYKKVRQIQLSLGDKKKFIKRKLNKKQLLEIYGISI